MGIKGVVIVAVINNDQVAVALEPLGEHDLALEHRAYGFSPFDLYINSTLKSEGLVISLPGSSVAGYNLSLHRYGQQPFLPDKRSIVQRSTPLQPHAAESLFQDFGGGFQRCQRSLG